MAVHGQVNMSSHCGVLKYFSQTLTTKRTLPFCLQSQVTESLGLKQIKGEEGCVGSQLQEIVYPEEGMVGEETWSLMSGVRGGGNKVPGYNVLVH